MIRITIANITKFVFNAFLCCYAAYAQFEKFIRLLSLIWTYFR